MDRQLGRAVSCVPSTVWLTAWLAVGFMGGLGMNHRVRAGGADAPAVDAAAEQAARMAQRVAVIEKAIDDCAEGATDGLALDASLLDKGAVKAVPAKTIKVDTSNYPMDEMMEGHQAILIVSYLIDSLGNPRFVHVDRQIAADVKFNGFTGRATDMFRKGTFSPATIDDKPMASWRRTKVKFTIDSDGRMGNILSDDALTKLVKKARTGDLRSQLVVSYADSIAHEEVGIPSSEQRHFLAVAAAAGERTALMRIAQLLGFPHCMAPPEVEDYIRRQALSGKSDLELVQATRLLDRRDPAGFQDAGVMLHGAANANDPFVQLWAAGILATTPIESLRDPAAALATARSLDLSSDPDAKELLAAALAANGQYAEAVRQQTAAITTATRMHWKVDFMQQRLAKYTTGEPWIGYLCDCDRLVPGGGL